eukprot:6196534-Pleurochrysis_carterae.AAC.8
MRSSAAKPRFCCFFNPPSIALSLQRLGHSFPPASFCPCLFCSAHSPRNGSASPVSKRDLPVGRAQSGRPARICASSRATCAGHISSLCTCYGRVADPSQPERMCTHLSMMLRPLLRDHSRNA